MLAIGMMAHAQNQIITKKLQLNNVPAGANTDKVLVRGGTDKVVKEVLRSTLLPSLSDVLTVGNTANLDIIRSNTMGVPGNQQIRSTTMKPRTSTSAPPSCASRATRRSVRTTTRWTRKRS